MTTPSTGISPQSFAPLTLETDFPYSLHSRQWDAFLATDANELFYGGAKFGGKSFLMRFALIMWALIAPGLQQFLFRREYKELMKNHMEGALGFKAMLGRMVKKGFVKIVSKEVRFANGSMIYLNHLQHDKYLSAWQGVEMHVLAIDQLEQFSEAAYRYLRANVRIGGWVPPPGMEHVFPRILNSGNPGGISHKFVKDTFVGKPEENRAFKRIKQSAEEGGMTRVFIPAKAEDNPTLHNDPDYLARLEGYGNPELVRALREGDWEVVAGSMFGYVWRNDRHICESFPIPISWPVWRGGDDGFKAPASVHWLTVDPDTDTIYVVDEIYQAGLLPEQLGEMIVRKDRMLERSIGRRVELSHAEFDGEMDSASFTDIGSGTLSRADQMNRKGCKWRPVDKPNHSRILRAQMLHKLMAPNPKMPKDTRGVPLPGIRFFRRCVNAINTIPALPIDKNNPEDVDTDSEDHAYDSVTYGLTRKRWKVGVSRVLGT